MKIGSYFKCSILHWMNTGCQEMNLCFHQLPVKNRISRTDVNSSFHAKPLADNKFYYNIKWLRKKNTLGISFAL